MIRVRALSSVCYAMCAIFSESGMKSADHDLLQYNPETLTKKKMEKKKKLKLRVSYSEAQCIPSQ